MGYGLWLIDYGLWLMAYALCLFCLAVFLVMFKFHQEICYSLNAFLEILELAKLFENSL